MKKIKNLTFLLVVILFLLNCLLFLPIFFYINIIGYSLYPEEILRIIALVSVILLILAYKKKIYSNFIGIKPLFAFITPLTAMNTIYYRDELFNFSLLIYTLISLLSAIFLNVKYVESRKVKIVSIGLSVFFIGVLLIF